MQSNDTTITIQLTRGYSAIIDECDADLARFNWSIRNAGLYIGRGYREYGIKKTALLHRVIMSRILGRELLSYEIVDHIDNNRMNNRRNNLRLADRYQNQHNTNARANNTSGFKGVFWRKERNRWVAVITVKGKTIYLGSAKTAEEASDIYKDAAFKYHGKFAKF